ncbi:MFS general substrate transporter [Melanogaster broomeanus]|nr:MFS general substrate transporter [Melanogaster broomeanus]
MNETGERSSCASDCDESVPLLPSPAVVIKRPTPLPKLQITILLLVSLIEPIASQCILPFINEAKTDMQLVADLDITGGDKRKVGYYAGLIESLFFVTQALTTLQWGRLSDYVGRKPVLLMGTFGLGLSMLCFGLSSTFWGLVASRCITGALNGNVGVMKSMMGELTDETNRAQGFAFQPMIRSAGVALGPIIGGSLSRPQEQFAPLFSGTFWAEYPYFLPCFVVTIFAAFTFVVLLTCLNETLPGTFLSKPPPTVVDREACCLYGATGDADSETLESPVPLRSLLIPKILLPIACYGSIAMLEIAMFALQPLFYSTPIELGGLGFSPATIGFWMSGLGIGNGIFQAFFFAPLVSKVGSKTMFRIGHGAFIVVFALFPLTSVMAKTYGSDSWSVKVLLFCQVCFNVMQATSFTSILMFIVAPAPNQRSLGAINGLAQTTASALRAIAPWMATSMFAYSVEYNILGGYGVYLVMVLMTLATTGLGGMLPAEPGRWTDHR